MTEPIDFQAEAAEMEKEAQGAKSALAHVAALVQTARVYEKKLEDAESEIKKLKEHLRKLSEELIPDVMNQAGLRQVKLEDGTTVTVKDEVRGAITKANEAEAAAWLQSNGAGGLIKRAAAVDVPVDFDLETFRVEMQQLGLTYNLSAKVHPQTLNAFLREQILVQGNKVPEKLFGVYQFKLTTIK